MSQRTVAWRALGLIVSSMLTLALSTWVLMASADAQVKAPSMSKAITGSTQGTPTADATMTELQKEKLKQEIDQLQGENSRSWWTSLSPFAAISIALATLIAAIIGFLQWYRNRKDEQKKQDEERFRAVAAALGDQQNEARIGAAIMLRTFVSKGYEQFHSQAFDLACVYLHLREIDESKPEPIDAMRQALITVFRESFPSVRKSLKKGGDSLIYEEKLPLVLSTTGIQLDNAYLSFADLAEISLRDSYLRGALLYRTDLRNSILKRAKLRGANLSKAKLSGADLSWADLSETNLKGADPEVAEYLHGTKMSAVKGLTQVQREACIKKGAIFDSTDQPAIPDADKSSSRSDTSS